MRKRSREEKKAWRRGGASDGNKNSQGAGRQREKAQVRPRLGSDSLPAALISLGTSNQRGRGSGEVVKKGRVRRAHAKPSAYKGLLEEAGKTGLLVLPRLPKPLQETSLNNGVRWGKKTIGLEVLAALSRKRLLRPIAWLDTKSFRLGFCSIRKAGRRKAYRGKKKIPEGMGAS